MTSKSKKKFYLPGRLERCCILNCYNKRNVDLEIRLYKFPKNDQVLDMWLVNCKLEKKDVMKKHICSQHFEKEFRGERYLKKNAIPTIFDWKPKFKYVDEEEYKARGKRFKKCSIHNCTGSNRTYRMFRFPTNETLKLKWYENCGFTKSFNSKNKYICERHFLSCDLLKRQLRKESVPQLDLNLCAYKTEQEDETKRNQYDDTASMNSNENEWQFLSSNVVKRQLKNESGPQLNLDMLAHAYTSEQEVETKSNQYDDTASMNSNENEWQFLSSDVVKRQLKKVSVPLLSLNMLSQAYITDQEDDNKSNQDDDTAFMSSNENEDSTWDKIITCTPTPEKRKVTDNKYDESVGSCSNCVKRIRNENFYMKERIKAIKKCKQITMEYNKLYIRNKFLMEELADAENYIKEIQAAYKSSKHF